MINNSLEWEDKREVLKTQIKSLPFNIDLRKMLKNIDLLVDNLSKAEVLARRNRQKIADLKELKLVNDAIDNLEKYLIMGNLLF